MLIEAILGNLSSDSLSSEAHVDWVDFDWAECGKRAHRKRSRAGRLLRILLPIGQTLRHGDHLANWPDTGERLAVHLLPTQVLVGRPASTSRLALLGYELGNLHMPVQIEDGQLMTLPDGPAEAAFARLGIEYTCELRRFTPHPVGSIKPTLSSSFEISRAR